MVECRQRLSSGRSFSLDWCWLGWARCAASCLCMLDLSRRHPDPIKVLCIKVLQVSRLHTAQLTQGLRKLLQAHSRQLMVECRQRLSSSFHRSLVQRIALLH